MGLWKLCFGMRFIICRNPFSQPIYLLANYMEQSLSYSIKQYLRHVVGNVCLSSLSHGKRCKYTIYYVISVAVARVFSKSANSLFWGSDNCFFKHSIQEKYYKKCSLQVSSFTYIPLFSLELNSSSHKIWVDDHTSLPAQILHFWFAIHSVFLESLF